MSTLHIFLKDGGDFKLYGVTGWRMERQDENGYIYGFEVTHQEPGHNEIMKHFDKSFIGIIAAIVQE